jgi:hypothetical protein
MEFRSTDSQRGSSAQFYTKGREEKGQAYLLCESSFILKLNEVAN